jgi:hypothetical protein
MSMLDASLQIHLQYNGMYQHAHAYTVDESHVYLVRGR